MQSHTLYQEAMPRGAAVQVAREIGYADGSFPRRWRRQLARPDNLATGELSPWLKGKVELLAQDRVDTRAADILLWDAIADLARQRARMQPDTRDTVLLALTQGFYSAVKALTLNLSREVLEVELYRLGAAVVRALVWVLGDDGAVDGVPLRLVDERSGRIARAIAWLRRF